MGHPAIDAALGGGIAAGRLHEIFARDVQDASSAAGFAAMLARLIGGALLWVRMGKEERIGGKLYAPGLCEIGLDPSTAIFGVLPDAVSVLRAGIDIARCPDVGVALIELWKTPRELDQVASRRLAVAAENAGTTVLLLRIDAEPSPSVAQTRWSVTAAPSAPLPANAPGHATFDVELLRQRGRAQAGRWRVEWDRERARFVEPGLRDHAAPLSGDRVPDAFGGSLAPGAGPRRQSGG
ncbi:conserved hypothetical protein [Sphingomonas sp. EC-HK361]|nr:conserved hypothetical protein [Sphingomonas sp. EC-HK361]